MLTLVVYVPNTHVDAVKEALFAAGAGELGDYRRCSWQVQGTGQFEPLPAANPFIGEAGQLERVPEWRVEILVREAVLPAVIQALKQAHPYEEPAYAVYAMQSVE